jgi:general stress protein 26
VARSNNSGKFDELEANPEVNVSYLNTSTSDWVSISGKGKVSNDLEEIKRIYNPTIKSWFGQVNASVRSSCDLKLLQRSRRRQAHWRARRPPHLHHLRHPDRSPLLEAAVGR